MGTRGTTARV